MEGLSNITELTPSKLESEHTSLFNKTFEAISENVVGRSIEILAIRYALITGQHVLLYGPHGTAKSFLAKEVFKRIDNATFFEVQLRKEMGADYIFGPMDIKKYREEAKVTHNTKGMLPKCDFAFMDEFFDANDNVLRGLLQCLFERKFMGKHIPLRSVIATTNFYEEDERKNAVIDRFMYRVLVDPLTRRNDKYKMFNVYNNLTNIEASFDVGALDEYESKIKEVPFNKNDAKVLMDIVDDFSNKIGKSYPVSDRRLCWCSDVVRASAVMGGRNKVSLEDFSSLYFTLGVAKSSKYDEAFFAALDKVFTEMYQKKTFAEDSVTKTPDTDAISFPHHSIRKMVENYVARVPQDKVDKNALIVLNDIEAFLVDMDPEFAKVTSKTGKKLSKTSGKSYPYSALDITFNKEKAGDLFDKHKEHLVRLNKESVCYTDLSWDNVNFTVDIEADVYATVQLFAEKINEFVAYAYSNAVSASVQF